MSNPYNPYDQQPAGFQQQPGGYQPNLDPNYAFTPQPPQGPVLANWGQRFGAYLIDALIAWVPGIIVLLVSNLTVAEGVVFLVLLGFGGMEGATGQTPGKKVVGLRLAKLADGSLLGVGMGVLRKFLHILDQIPCLLGYLWPIWDNKRQTFADKIVSSVVVVSK